MTPTEIRAVLDAHDALVRDCAQGRLTFSEFLGAYGDFPYRYALAQDTTYAEESEALRLFRKRVAFHKQVAGVIWGLRGTAKLGSLEESGVGDFLPVVGLIRLRELVARYPKFEAAGGNMGAGSVEAHGAVRAKSEPI
jgi:hypothetical protein